MALSTPRIIGRQLTVTCSGTKTIWQELSLTFTADTANATAADSIINEVVITTMMLEFTLSGFLGSVNNGGTLPQVGAVISDFAVAVGADSVVPSLTNYTTIKVIRAEYRFEAGPGNFNLSGRSGVLNTAPF